jgi:hypothetical protein
MNSREAVEGWIRHRDGVRVVGFKPDEHSIASPRDKDFIDANDFGPDYYAFCRVQEALGLLCKLRSQRETLVQLLVHCYSKGLPIRSFMGVNYGWEHEALLQTTMDAIHSAVEARLEAVPVAEVKSVEMA